LGSGNGRRLQRLHRSQSKLDVARQVTLNRRLAVSTAGETVLVESATQQIESQTITVGQVIDNRSVQDLTVLCPGFLARASLRE
jgi:hypothetical protein